MFPGSVYRARDSRSFRRLSVPSTPSRRRRINSVGSSSSNRIERAGCILLDDLDMDDADDLRKLTDRLDKLRFAMMMLHVMELRCHPLEMKWK